MKEKKKRDKKKIGKRLLKTFLALLIIVALLAGVLAIGNTITSDSTRNYISTIGAVEYEEQLVPTLDDMGNYTFECDREFRIMQLTDTHFGGGVMSTQKDAMAINAIATMIKAEKPDLVVITGDIAYPVPFQAGTFNNKTGALMMAELMEQLGVYWMPTFGNHDTETYSYYNREEIAEIYESDLYPHCLFQSGPEDVDGVGNYVVNVKDEIGQITQSLFVFDSNSYLEGDALGILWNYDCIHKNQIEWYEKTLDAITQQNAGIMPKSLAFFHIPPIEMRDAYYAYRDNGFQNTQDVEYIYGVANEQNEIVFSSELNEGLVDKFIEKGSTQGVFFGHDHVNSIALKYKGITFAYGYSVDYLAYVGIAKHGAQRGCTMITLDKEGNFTSVLENYYQDKYQSETPKEEVVMTPYNEENV